MQQEETRRRFELLALPHLDAAYNLARWLAGNAADAEDIVQEAYLRAFRYFDAWQGGNFRVWLLTIVRNSFLTWVRENRSARLTFPGTEPSDAAAPPLWTSPPPNPEELLTRRMEGASLAELTEALPDAFREVIVLRELEDLSYREIATVTGVPVGTVMSRLARARSLLRQRWLARDSGESRNAV